jgi:hypothetical protein
MWMWGVGGRRSGQNNRHAEVLLSIWLDRAKRLDASEYLSMTGCAWGGKLKFELICPRIAVRHTLDAQFRKKM